MLSPLSLRVAMYARVSSEEQREGQTIDSQIAELERFANAQGWIVTNIYKDEGWSGAVLARPALDRLRDDASKSLFDLVLLNDVDRLARDVSHLGIIKRDLERKRVQVRFRKLPAEQSPTGNLMVNILGSFAEFERELIADRTRRGRRHKVEARQQFLGCLAPYGYRYVTKNKSIGNDGYLEIVPEEAAVVRDMFRWVAQEGLSARRVTQRLTLAKIPPKKGGAKWGRSSVLRILRCQTYMGIWHYNKNESYEPAFTERSGYRRSPKYRLRQRPQTEWIAVPLPESLRIIDGDQWEQVQTQLARNRVFASRNATHSYLLSGLVQCGGCNATYVGDPCHGKFYYRCGQRCRKYPTIQEERLNEVVWETTKALLLTPAIIKEQLHTRAQEVSQKVVQQKGEQAEIQQAMENLTEQERRIVEAYRTGILTLELLQHELAQLQSRKARLSQRQIEIGTEESASGFLSMTHSVEDTCQKLACQAELLSDGEKQQFLRLLIEKIIFTGDQITIRGVLPSSPSAESKEAKRGEKDSFATSGIVTTEIYSHGHNSVIQAAPEIENIPFEVRQEIAIAKPLRSEENLRFVRDLVKRYPKAVLRELCTKFEQKQNQACSITSMARMLKQLGMPSQRSKAKKI